jgi:hypothetical protein
MPSTRSKETFSFLFSVICFIFCYFCDFFYVYVFHFAVLRSFSFLLFISKDIGC